MTIESSYRVLISDIGVLTLTTVLFISFALTLIIVLTRNRHIDRSARSHDLRAVQAMHRAPTPRLGGVGIFVAMIASVALLPEGVAVPSWPLVVLSTLPVFIAGLAEDLGMPVRPRVRLLAAVVSGAVAAALLGAWITRIGVPGFDALLTFAPLAILFTLFASAGICHAFNLIDGLNGLSSAMAMAVAACLYFIAVQSGEVEIAATSLIVVAAIAGFFLLNYPFGIIFLGDAGAYSIGHVVSWLAIVLLWNVPGLTSWSIALIFFWPAADTLLSVWRRWVLDKPADQPDKLHFHHLVMRTLEIRWIGRNRRSQSNPLTSLIILGLAAPPMVAGVVFWDNPRLACAAFLMFSGLFFVSFLVGLRVANGRPMFAPSPGLATTRKVGGVPTGNLRAGRRRARR